MQTKILKPNSSNIRLVAQQIKSGGIVAFATETVYGLGANAFDDQAVNQIFTIKGRPNDNPLIVHLANAKQIEKVAYVDQRARLAIKKFMPGALTIILKKKQSIAPSVTCGLDTVGIRIPQNRIARKFIAQCGVPLAAPSANSSTKPSPTQANHVLDDLNGKIAYILDGGNCKVGLESTIIDLSTDKIRLLRKGGISIERLEKVLGAIEIISPNNSEKPISPGTKYVHYAPNAQVTTFDYRCFDQLNQLKIAHQGKKIRILSISQIEGATVFKNAQQYAKRLFFEFRLADKQGIELIICERPPENGVGGAINNRLSKACGKGDNSYESQGK